MLMLEKKRMLDHPPPHLPSDDLPLTSKEICPSLTMLMMFWFFLVSSSTSPPAPPPPPNPLGPLLPPPPPPPPGPGAQDLEESCLPTLHPGRGNIIPGPPGGSTPGLWLWESG